MVEHKGVSKNLEFVCLRLAEDVQYASKLRVLLRLTSGWWLIFSKYPEASGHVFSRLDMAASSNYKYKSVVEMRN
jgi:hypothetical protein